MTRPSPAPAVAAWIAGRDADALCRTAVNEAELLCGVATVPAGSRRNELEAAMLRWLHTGFAEGIPPFDGAAARDYAQIAQCRAMAPITRNVRDFRDIDVEIIDSWTAT